MDLLGPSELLRAWAGRPGTLLIVPIRDRSVPFDRVRVLPRLPNRVQAKIGIRVVFTDHPRTGKRRLYRIHQENRVRRHVKLTP